MVLFLVMCVFLIGEHKVTLVAPSMLVQFLLLLQVLGTEYLEAAIGVTEFVATCLDVGVGEEKY
jgi:hypothetical protein